MNPPFSIASRLLLLTGLIFTSTAALRAVDPEPAPDAGTSVAVAVLPSDQLDQLLGPIALYPDALIALILPASTSQAEIVLAARYIAAKGDPAQIDGQPWSDSVKALARYPEVITWMDTNLQWTKELGDAFLSQPADVMNSVQRLRTTARANGALVDTPQQKVVLEDDAIEIVPAEPDIIYVPRYDPEVVYVDSPLDYPDYGPFITFGIGLPVGIWLNYDFDWHRRTIWVGDRHRGWQEQRNWHRSPGRPNPPSNWHAWRPPVNRPIPPRDPHRPPPVIQHPRPLPGTPNHPRPPRRNDVNPPRGENHPRPQVNNAPPAFSVNRATPPSSNTQLVVPPANATRSFGPPASPQRATPSPAPVPQPRPQDRPPVVEHNRSGPPAQHAAPAPKAPPPKPDRDSDNRQEK